MTTPGSHPRNQFKKLAIEIGRSAAPGRRAFYRVEKSWATFLPNTFSWFVGRRWRESLATMHTGRWSCDLVASKMWTNITSEVDISTSALWGHSGDDSRQRVLRTRVQAIVRHRVAGDENSTAVKAQWPWGCGAWFVVTNVSFGVRRRTCSPFFGQAPLYRWDLWKLITSSGPHWAPVSYTHLTLPTILLV